MPWRVEKRGGEYVVVKEATGEVVGRHDSEAKAQAQKRALYANVNEDMNTRIRRTR